MTEDIDQLETASNKGICHKEWLKSQGHPQNCGGGHTRCPGSCRMSPPQNLGNASFFSFLGRCICSVWPHPATTGPRRANVWACSICGGRQALRLRGWVMADPAQRKGFQEPKRNDRCPPEPTSLTAWQQGNSFSQFLHFKTENAFHGHSDTTPLYSQECVHSSHPPEREATQGLVSAHFCLWTRIFGWCHCRLHPVRDPLTQWSQPSSTPRPLCKANTL